MEKRITDEYARECLRYEPETGAVYWLVRPREHFRTERGWKIFNTQLGGKRASHVSVNGYCEIRVDNWLYKSHRLIWLMVHGEWPEHQIDHIDGNRLNNRLGNLRAVTHSENCRNICIPSHNTSGVLGVWFSKEKRLWCAEIHLNGRKRHLGYFKNIEDAAAARKEADVKYGFSPLHGRPPVTHEAA